MDQTVIHVWMNFGLLGCFVFPKPMRNFDIHTASLSDRFLRVF